ncbi:hypothetical protein [Pseudomonas lactucae]|uniref:Uncharacterized protein n=1 Tax=Pseudomonas lactucae TaxID=2813360 RepID=A0A9X0Y965_9PSED|nr:hypothetical protein [Pseudomonas lactucae]MBN2974882.1 hypothetical protein [Pseudomonas lactucae]
MKKMPLQASKQAQHELIFALDQNDERTLEPAHYLLNRPRWRTHAMLKNCHPMQENR